MLGLPKVCPYLCWAACQHAFGLGSQQQWSPAQGNPSNALGMPRMRQVLSSPHGNPNHGDLSHRWPTAMTSPHHKMLYQHHGTGESRCLQLLGNSMAAQGMLP